MRETWKDRRGVLKLDAVVRVSSTGWYDPGYVGGPPEECREPEGEDNREIISVQLGEVTVDASTPHVLRALAGIVEPHVTDADDAEFDWEESE